MPEIPNPLDVPSRAIRLGLQAGARVVDFAQDAASFGNNSAVVGVHEAIVRKELDIRNIDDYTLVNIGIRKAIQAQNERQQAADRISDAFAARSSVFYEMAGMILEMPSGVNRRRAIGSLDRVLEDRGMNLADIGFSQKAQRAWWDFCAQEMRHASPDEI